MTRRLVARPRRDERGAGSVETVLVVPLLLLLIMTIVQFALWYHGAHVAIAAAQDGARVARLEGGTCTAGQDRARAVLAATGRKVVLDPNVEASRCTADTVRIEVRGRAPSIVPGFPSLPIRAASAGPTERFRPPGS